MRENVKCPNKGQAKNHNYKKVKRFNLSVLSDEKQSVLWFSEKKDNTKLNKYSLNDRVHILFSPILKGGKRLRK
jgi:hypothetical protein